MGKRRYVILLVLTLVVLVNPTQVGRAQLADSPWPKFMHDLQNTGRSHYVGPQENTVKWAYQTDGWLASSPVIGPDGTIYFSTYNDNKFYALNPDGAPKWFYQVGWKYWTPGTPAISTNGTVYFTVAPKENKLYAIRDDGDYATVKWSFETGEPIYSSPTIGLDGTVYLGTAPYENKLYAVRDDGDRATVKWFFQSNEYIILSPAIGADGTVYVCSRKNLYALYDSDDHVTVRWVFYSDSPISAAPSIGMDNTIYLSTSNGKLYALYDNGSVKWSSAMGEEIISIPSIAADGTIYVGVYDNEWTWLFATSPDGTQRWSFQAKRSVSMSNPVIDNNGTIYFSSEDTLYSLNSNGTLKWSYTTAGIALTHSATSSPSISSTGVLYIAWETPDGGYAVYAFGPVAERPQLQHGGAFLIVCIAGAITVLIILLAWRRRR